MQGGLLESYEGNIQLKSESFYLLSFNAWLTPFSDNSHWEYRSANQGVFGACSCLLLFAQMIVLFDLAYEENLASYHCQGKSASFSVIICAILVLLIVALKMLSEERRCFVQRLIIVKHCGVFSFANILYNLIDFRGNGNNSNNSNNSNSKSNNSNYCINTKYAKLLVINIFQKIREYGVISFVYVACVEQLMLFETIIDYIINSVVVLVIAELDELLFNFLAKIESMENEEHEDADDDDDDEDAHEIFDNPADTAHTHVSSSSQDNSMDEETPFSSSSSSSFSPPPPPPPLPTPVPTFPPTSTSTPGDIYTNNVDSNVKYPTNEPGSKYPLSLKPHEDSTGGESSYSAISLPSTRRANSHSHSHRDSRLNRPSLGDYTSGQKKTISQMTGVSIHHREFTAFGVFDYCIVRANYIIMLIPLIVGKMTGHHCPETSTYRVSEIAMVALLVSRVCLNLYIDLWVLLRPRLLDMGPWSQFKAVVGSLLEHGGPCFAYLSCMYLVFVKLLKPAGDDE